MMRHKGVRVLLVILLVLSASFAAFWYAFACYNVKLSKPEHVVYEGQEVKLTREREKKDLAVFGIYSVVYKGYDGETPVFLTVRYTKEEYAALVPDAPITGYAYYIVRYPAETYLTFDHKAERSEIDETLRSQEIKLALTLSVPGDILLIVSAALLLLLLRNRKASNHTTAPAAAS